MDKYKKLTLRAGGNAAFVAKYNDAYWQSLIKDLKCDTQSSRVCVVYIDGEYWGLYILQEDYCDNYWEEKYGVNKDNVISYKGETRKSMASDMTLMMENFRKDRMMYVISGMIF